jgi:hypothetical protein
MAPNLFRRARNGSQSAGRRRPAPRDSLVALALAVLASVPFGCTNTCDDIAGRESRNGAPQICAAQLPSAYDQPAVAGQLQGRLIELDRRYRSSIHPGGDERAGNDPLRSSPSMHAANLGSSTAVRPGASAAGVQFCGCHRST